MSICAVLAVPATSEAAAQSADATVSVPLQVEQLVDSPLRPVPNYSNASDHELTRVGAQWDDLSKDEKDALLKEVKLRMAQRKDRDGVLMIRTQRRYGRVYGGGQYLKIETKVVRITPKQPDASSPGRGFGVGFEQRSAQVTEPADDTGLASTPAPDAESGSFESPVVRVTEVSQ